MVKYVRQVLLPIDFEHHPSVLAAFEKLKQEAEAEDAKKTHLWDEVSFH